MPWRSGPERQTVFDLHFSEEKDERLKWRVANTYWHDFNRNKVFADRKGNALALVVRLLVIQTALVAAVLLLLASSGSDTKPHSEYPGAAARGARVVLAVVLPEQAGREWDFDLARRQ